MTISTTSARKTPVVHLSERVRVITVQEGMRVMFPGRACSKGGPAQQVRARCSQHKIAAPGRTFRAKCCGHS
ncbi:flagella basal body P-ring formation protein FlgA [Accumulibacter sp.]|uniref:flagella basal body P-ring formation protein FlgA n=1 Tax=Accumulibacter sp. TaxID=2053492 RepID=UPI00342A6383